MSSDRDFAVPASNAVADGSITAAKLAEGAVTSAKILDGTIVDADINSSAAIAASKVAGIMRSADNLSDVADVAASRTSLGLGGAAVLNVGTASSTVAAGNDSRITGAAQKASNLGDLASASTARTNLGLGGSATLAVGTTAGTVAAGDDSRITGAAQKTDNLSVFAATTSAQLAGVISNETGTGALVFGTAPALSSPTGLVKGDVGLSAVTNDAQVKLSTVTAKGDLIVASGSAAVANVAAGTNGQTLVADSNATSGVKYLANAGITTYGPLDLGWLGGNGDPATCPGGTLLSASGAAGVLVVTRIRIPIACTVTNLLVYLTASGSGLTANQCLAALYTSAGAWVRTTTNMATKWAAAAGLVTMDLTSTYAAAAGDYYIGMYYNGTTAPTFARYAVTSAALSNAGLAAPNLRFASTSDTSLTTAPPTTSFGTQTAAAASFFAAVS